MSDICFQCHKSNFGVLKNDRHFVSQLDHLLVISDTSCMTFPVTGKVKLKLKGN
jgi:hypothetical protein